MTNFAYLITTKSIIVHFEGTSYTVERTTQKAEKLIQVLKAKDYTKLKEVLCPGKDIQAKTKDLFTVNFKNGTIVAKGDKTPIHKSISTKLLTFIKEELPCDGLVNFWNNLKKNPSKRSIEQLYDFLEKNHHPITESGHFIAYKRVDRVTGQKMVDNYTKKIDNSLGAVVKMDRKKVNSDPNQTCSTGLHVASFDYAKSYAGNVLITVLVNPKDVVAVPTDYNNQKMRVCEYKVLEIYEKEKEMKDILVKNVKKPITKKIVQTNKKPIPLTGKQIDMTEMSATEIINFVRKKLRIKFDLNPKNKQQVVKEAVVKLESKGWTVIAIPDVKKR